MPALRLPTKTPPCSGADVFRPNVPPGVERALNRGDRHAPASDTDGDGRDQITTQFGALNLNGNSALGAVQVTLRSSSLSPFQNSLGEMEEQVNNHPGELDLDPFTASGKVSSFFDVYLEVTIAGIVYHNEFPWHISGVFSRTPCLPGEDYLNVGDVQLFDSSNEGSRYSLHIFHYFPNPWSVMIPLVMR